MSSKNGDNVSAEGVASQDKNELVAEPEIAPSDTLVIEAKLAAPSGEILTSGREKAAHLRENALGAREAAADTREDAAGVREAAAQTREGEVYVREKDATSRELEIHAEKNSHLTFSDHITMLQEANANLVTASIEATRLAEQVQATKDELNHLAHHDPLTNLPNRMLLQDRVNKAIELARRQGGQLAVLFMDLDQFKYINDSLGHGMGDKLLQSVARRLTTCVRQADTISRQGGDEFVLLLSDIEHAEDAALAARKILEAFNSPHRVDRHDLHIGVSIGISVYPNDGQDAESLVKAADTAMYYAKEGGRNNYKFFEENMHIRAVQRQFIEANLRNGLARQEFVLAYQPKINFQSGAIVGVEALIRWQHPERGLLLPAQFISIAEDCGLILPIGRWVLRQACHQAQLWLQAGLAPITMAVNTSALEFRAKDFIDNVQATLKEMGMEPRYLEIELTESILMRDAESSDSVLQALASLGVQLAIDDFGTGFSSLSYLRHFPIDTLKIDQSFVSRMIDSPSDASIVSTVIGLGKSLKHRVIAEGVETLAQYEFLRSQQCDEGQGYYFGRPVTAEAMGTLLQSNLMPTLTH